MIINCSLAKNALKYTASIVERKLAPDASSIAAKTKKGVTNVFKAATTEVRANTAIGDTFVKRAGLVVEAASNGELSKSASKIIEKLDNYIANPRYTKYAEETKKLLLEQPEILNSLPEKDISLYALHFIGENKGAWKPEFANLPFEQFKNPFLFEDYFNNLIKDSSLGVYEFNPKLLIHSFGPKSHPMRYEFYDLSSLKNPDGSYNLRRVVKYLKGVKNASAAEFENSGAGIYEFAAGLGSVKKAVKKYPKAIEKVLESLNNSSSKYKLNGYSEESLKTMETFLNSGLNSERLAIDSLLQKSKIYGTLMQSEVLKQLNNEEMEAAIKIFERLHIKVYPAFCEAEPAIQCKVVELIKALEGTVKSDYIKTVLSVADSNEYLVKIVNDTKLLDEISKNKELLDYMLCAKNYAINGKKIATSPEIVTQLAIMKTLRPKEFAELSKTKGFKDIIQGKTDLEILTGMNFTSGNEFFSNVYGRFEQIIQNSKFYKYLSPEAQEAYLDLLMRDPVNCQSIARAIDLYGNNFNSYYNRVLNGAINGYKNFFKQHKTITNVAEYKELQILKNNISKALTHPKEGEFICQFGGNFQDIAIYIDTVKKGRKLSDNVKEILFNNRNLFDAKTINSIMSVNDQFCMDTALTSYIIPMLKSGKINKNQLSFILNNTSINNGEFLINELQKGSTDIEKLMQTMYLTKNIRSFKDTAASKEVLSVIEELKSLTGSTIKGYDSMGFKDLLKLRLENPDKYKELADSGIFEYVKANGGHTYLFMDISKNSTLSGNILRDLKLWKAGVSNDIISFSKNISLKEAFEQTQVGDIVELGNKLYINDGKQLYLWKMSKEKYQELFPLVERFATKQNRLGDCYLVSSINNIMRNPKARAQLLKSYELDGNDIKVTIQAYKDFDGTTIFKDGIINLDNKYMHMFGAKGLQILEQSYARTALREHYHDIFTNANSSYINNLMSRIPGGFSHIATQELLGTPEFLTTPKIPESIIDQSVMLYKNNDFMQVLNKYNKNSNYILGFSTISKDKMPSESAIDNTYNIVSNHAYSFLNLDEAAKTVTISNPHNGSLDITLPVEVFKKYIDTLYITPVI